VYTAKYIDSDNMLHISTNKHQQAAASTAEGAALCALWLTAAAAAHSAQHATAAAQAAAAAADTQGPTAAATTTTLSDTTDATATVATVAWPLEEYPEVYEWGSDSPVAVAAAHQVRHCIYIAAILCHSTSV
jgi:hypothetical protein